MAQTKTCGHCGRTFAALNREYAYIKSTVGRMAAEEFEAKHDDPDDDNGPDWEERDYMAGAQDHFAAY